MEIKQWLVTARSVTFELCDGGYYDTKKSYTLILNGAAVGQAAQVVTTLFGLKPQTSYKLEVFSQKQSSGSLCFRTEGEFVTLNVRDFGAKGDGENDDTSFLQAAISACPKGGRVLIPQGRYLTSPLFLKSHLRLELAKGAVLLGHTDRRRYPVLPGLVESDDEQSEYNLGSWEGNPLAMYAALLTGIQVHDVVLYGQGVLDGQANQSDWWSHPTGMYGGAGRGRMLFLNRCEQVVMQGLTVQNSPAWNLHPYFSKDLGFYNITVLGPSSSPNTDGFDPESCENVRLIGARISVGDDCVAIKAGKLYMGEKYHTPCSNVQIAHCRMEEGHGSVTLGSEMAGGIKDVWVHDCEFVRTDRGLRVKTRRGRGRNAVIDGICFERILMRQVSSPFVVNSFYFCDPDGKSEYVQCRSPLPVDERTPSIGTLRFQNINATECQTSAGFFLGLPEQKIAQIDMKNIEVSFDLNAKAAPPAMASHVQPCLRKGVIAENVRKMSFHNVRLNGVLGDELTLTHVDEVEGWDADANRYSPA